MLGDSEYTFSRERRMGGWLTVRFLLPAPTRGRKVGVWLPSSTDFMTPASHRPNPGRAVRSASWKPARPSSAEWRRIGAENADDNQAYVTVP